MNKEILAWHFLPNNKRLRFDGNMEVEAGFIYYEDVKPILCRRGLHASIKPLDALRYAPGSILCRVVIRGDIILGKDKLVSNEREVVWVANAEDTLREFARWSALQVAHLWDMPSIVREYLETGDLSLKSAARSAAKSAARSAARSAAKSAAWSAARSAAWSAAKSAAWSAVKSATRGAAESAAENAAWSAAWSAAESAAKSAARGAAESAAWSAAWSAAESKQNQYLESLLLKLGDK